MEPEYGVKEVAYERPKALDEEEDRPKDKLRSKDRVPSGELSWFVDVYPSLFDKKRIGNVVADVHKKMQALPLERLVALDRQMRSERGHWGASCRRCGYDLRALSGTVCPECGTPL